MAPRVLGREGVGGELSFPGIEVNLHRPRLSIDYPSLSTPKDGLVAVSQVLHELAENVHKLSEILTVREKVPRGIGRRTGHLQF